MFLSFCQLSSTFSSDGADNWGTVCVVLLFEGEISLADKHKLLFSVPFLSSWIKMCAKGGEDIGTRRKIFEGGFMYFCALHTHTHMVCFFYHDPDPGRWTLIVNMQFVWLWLCRYVCMWWNGMSFCDSCFGYLIGYDNITGETLHFVRVDRKMQGAHFCLASNGVPPTKSKRIVLEINCMTYLCSFFLSQEYNCFLPPF